MRHKASIVSVLEIDVDVAGEHGVSFVAEALVLIFPTVYALTGGLLLQWWLGYNFSVAVWVGYIALFGIAVETGVVMVSICTKR